MAPLGVVAAATMSVLSTKCLLILPCPRLWSPHRCGDPNQSRTVGRSSVVFLTPIALNFWKVNKHVAFSFLGKLLVYDQVIKLPSQDVTLLAVRRLEQQLEPSRSPQREHSPQRTTSEFWILELRNVTSAKS